MIQAARAEPILCAIFGPEPKGVTARKTFHVLSVTGYLRDEDSLEARISRAMVNKGKTS